MRTMVILRGRRPNVLRKAAIGTSSKRNRMITIPRIDPRSRSQRHRMAQRSINAILWKNERRDGAHGPFNTAITGSTHGNRPGNGCRQKSGYSAPKSKLCKKTKQGHGRILGREAKHGLRFPIIDYVLHLTRPRCPQATWEGVTVGKNH